MLTTYRYYRKYWDIAGYSYWADIYCADCGRDLPEIDPEGNNRSVIMAGELSEFDPQCNGGYAYHCGECGLLASEW